MKEREDGNVVLLAEVLSSGCKRSSARPAAQQLADPCEAEEPALNVLCFGNAIRHEHHRVSVGGILFALDRGMRERWPTHPDVVIPPKVVPCRPRLAYH